MEEKYERILRILYEESKKTTDSWIVGAEIGREGKENYHWLEDQGYIERAELIGRKSLRCKVTPKTYKYFSELEQNKN